MNQTDYSLSSYQEQLDEKIAILSNDFSEFDLPEIDIFKSDIMHFRMRAEFRMWHEGDTLHYVMFSADEYKKPYKITQFVIGSKDINQLMQKLLGELQTQPILKHKIFQTEFLTTLAGDSLITLIYHKPLTSEWIASATALQKILGVGIIGRSRGQRIVLDKDHVIEKLNVNGKDYYYQQIEASFTQPNAKVCESMLSWAVNNSKDFADDLLELYCGNGNFTLPLAQNFTKVLATEVAKPSVQSALFNIKANNIPNIRIARMASEELVQAIDGVREFNRLKDINLASYDFSTIFVDPPRAGMDTHTTSIAQRFDNIIYISCNPMTLRENLRQIISSHDIKAFAVFDQFPYTHHLECGVVLQKK